MSHELDFSKGRAAIAFRGETPWHGNGESILPQDDVETIRIKAGIDYDVVKTPALYTVPMDSAFPGRRGGGTGIATTDSSCVLYRSDTGQDLSIVSNKYQVVQPKEVIEFYRDLTEKFGFELEVVGALAGGRKVWALANTQKALALKDEDKVKGYLLLATSYDGTMATQARFTTIRVVCNNTLSMARGEGRADLTVPHSRKFDAEAVKNALGIGEAWERFHEQAEQMQARQMDKEEYVKLFLDAYYGLDTPEKRIAFRQDEKNDKKASKLIERLTDALFASPGAQLASARGTLWGALNAVTYDVDHKLPSRDGGTRLNKAWFGEGNAIKSRALQRALQMVVQ